MASYADILFGKIVLKNGLASPAAVQECLQIQETSRARGATISLGEVLVARGVITEENARLCQRAQALTQFQRAEAIYARIAHEKLGLAVPVLQQCFEVQKQRHFKVRIAQVLIERGLITTEQNEEIADEQILRIAEETRLQEEAGLFGNTQPQPLTQTRASPPQGDSWRGAVPPQPGASTRGVARPPQPVTDTRRNGGRPPEAETAESPPDDDPEVAAGKTMELDVPTVLPGVKVGSAIPMEDLASMSVRGGRFAPDQTGGKAQAPSQPIDPSNPANLIGKTISSRYRIIEKLGEGGMGTVYKAEHCLMEKIVAFKVLHPHLIANKESLERFRREVRAASRFQHKNVVQIYDAGEGEGGIFYMAMEFVEGKSLEDYLKQGPLPLDRTLTILRQSLKAIGEAHKKGIVHRDLKSDNIMITKSKHGDDLVKVMDFGIAKLVDGTDIHAESGHGEGDRVYKTMEGVVTGTPQYMSPEQASGEKVDHRADLYSLGVILFEMVTGTLPFTSNTPMGFLGKHIVEIPPPASQVCRERNVPAPPEQLEKIIAKLLEKKPDDRYQSAEQIAADLDSNVTQQLFDVAPASGSMSTERITPKEVKDRRRANANLVPIIVVGGVAFVAAIAIVIAVVVIFGGPDPDKIREDAMTRARAFMEAHAIDKAIAELDAAKAKVGDDSKMTKLRSEIDDKKKEFATADEASKLEESAAKHEKDGELDKAVEELRQAKEKLAGLGGSYASRAEALGTKATEIENESKRLARARAAKDKLAEAREARKNGQLDAAKTLLDEASRLGAPEAEVATEAAWIESDGYFRSAQEERGRDLTKALVWLDKAIDRCPDAAAKEKLQRTKADWRKEGETGKARQVLDQKMQEARDRLERGDLAEAEKLLRGIDAAALGLGADDAAKVQNRLEAVKLLGQGLQKDVAALLAEVKTLEEQDPRRTTAEATAALKRKLDGQRASPAFAALQSKDADVADILGRQLGQGITRLEVLERSLKDNRDRAVSESVRVFKVALDGLKAGAVAKLEGLSNVDEILESIDDVVAKLERLTYLDGYKDATQAAEKKWIDGRLRLYTSRKSILLDIPQPRSAWVQVTGGPYVIAGSKENVTLPDVYWICDHETTRIEWDAFRNAKGGKVPGNERDWNADDLPVASVSFDDAKKYCDWLTERWATRGKLAFRLPSEGEWERAARGKTGADYPWGNEWDDDNKAAVGRVQKIRSFPRNDLGLFDTAGNVAEMTSTILDGRVVTKGGSAMAVGDHDSLRASRRATIARGAVDLTVGFRAAAFPK